MRAMILSDTADVHDKPLVLQELPEPKPGPGEILIKVSACGVCRTDLHIVEGELPVHKQNVIPGHQVVGVVKETGHGVTRFKRGSRVGVAWLHHTCCNCGFCNRGDENLCLNAGFTGYDIDGGYAEYTVIHEDFAYELPDDFPDLKVAPLLCAGIIGYRTYKLSNIQPGGRLGIFGFGAAAHITIQIALYQGCEVYVFTRGESRRELAKTMGARWAGNSTDDPGVKLDSSMIFAPAGDLVPTALGLTERGGTVALGGIYMSPVPPMDYTKHLYHERVLRSVMNATRQDGKELLELAAKIPINSTITTFPLEETNEALIALKDGNINGAAVIQIAENFTPGATD